MILLVFLITCSINVPLNGTPNISIPNQQVATNTESQNRPSSLSTINIRKRHTIKDNPNRRNLFNTFISSFSHFFLKTIKGFVITGLVIGIIGYPLIVLLCYAASGEFLI